MSDLFAVIRGRGAAWNDDLPLRAQALWDPHAAFMDAAHADGHVALAGPLEGTREVLIIVRADDAGGAEAFLAADPWTASGHLRTVSVSPWNVLIGTL